MLIEDAVVRVLDCETTGFDPKTEGVCEIAVVDMTYKDGILDSATNLVNPGKTIPIDAMSIHHITNEMVANQPLLDVVWPSLLDGGEHGSDISAFAAHNGEFDFQFLSIGDTPGICTLRISRHLWPDLEKHSNQYLRYYLGVKASPDMPIHRAIGDATITALNLQVMMKIVIEEKGIVTVAQLIEWSERPVLLKTCRFGKKHNDEPWSKVPKSYLAWMKREVTDMDRDVAHTVDYWYNNK